MNGYRINPNKDHVMKIINATLEKDGHCPCQIVASDATLCPCDKLLKDGNCCCKLFLKINN